MIETDVFISILFFGIVMTFYPLVIEYFKTYREQKQKKKQDEIELNNKKTNDWLFHVETACNIEHLKRNPELWTRIYDTAKNYQEKDYLLDRYTYTHNGKRYWKQYKWKELKQDD